MSATPSLTHHYKIKMAKLQDRRNQKRLSQKQLAEAADVNVRVLQHYEQGFRDINGTKLSTLLKLCITLECPLEAILDDPDTLDLLEQYRKIIVK